MDRTATSAAHSAATPRHGVLWAFAGVAATGVFVALFWETLLEGYVGFYLSGALKAIGCM